MKNPFAKVDIQDITLGELYMDSFAAVDCKYTLETTDRTEKFVKNLSCGKIFPRKPFMILEIKPLNYDNFFAIKVLQNKLMGWIFLNMTSPTIRLMKLSWR